MPELITVTVRLEDGGEGTGYTYTGGRGGHAILAMIRLETADDCPQVARSVR